MLHPFTIVAPLALVLALPFAFQDHEEAQQDEHVAHHDWNDEWAGTPFGAFEKEGDEIAVTDGSVALDDGSELGYFAHAGRMLMRTEEGEERAAIFYVHYAANTVDGIVGEGTGTRPITFCFNGGPGSSSVWLHLGAFGPKRIDMGAEGFDLDPPYALTDNAHTLLPYTDLVFVDPVTTGFSRAAKDVNDNDFHGDRRDVESVGAFIRQFTTRLGAWDRPIYLAGESYGTARAAALSHHLQERYGLYPHGLLLVSAILNWQTARFDDGNDLPYALFLPTYAALAAYHGRVQVDDLETFLDRARAFAGGDYTVALMRGDALSEDERANIAARLAGFTGLSEEWILRANLRIEIGRFCKELRRDEGLTVGRLDGRYVGTDRDDVGERYEYDPSMSAIRGPYSMTLNQYVRETLGYESDLPYEILTGRVQPWAYERADNEYLNVTEDLRRAMNRNKALRVFVANGYHDLATPFYATEYTFDHLFIPAGLQDNIQMSYFDAGHMMYVKRSELAKLTRDIARFYAAADGPSEKR
jgi:carboxypeptidase C (cathepsin A)